MSCNSEVLLWSSVRTKFRLITAQDDPHIAHIFTTVWQLQLPNSSTSQVSTLVIPVIKSAFQLSALWAGYRNLTNGLAQMQNLQRNLHFAKKSPNFSHFTTKRPSETHNVAKTPIRNNRSQLFTSQTSRNYTFKTYVESRRTQPAIFRISYELCAR